MLLKKKKFIVQKRLSKKKNSSENLKSLRRISKEIFQVSKIQERFQNGWV